MPAVREARRQQAIRRIEQLSEGGESAIRKEEGLRRVLPPLPPPRGPGAARAGALCMQSGGSDRNSAAHLPQTQNAGGKRGLPAGVCDPLGG
ncbi:hypothetical protein GCM10009075_26930 [Sphingomonas trueperi]